MTPSQDMLVTFGQRFNLRDFVETGTQAGNLFRAVQGYFDRAFTIELFGVPPDLTRDFAGSERVFLFSGSSGANLEGILTNYRITRALFWLDAHGNETFYKDDGNNQVPLELAAIEAHAPDSLVLIDDITFANGKYWVNTSYEFRVPAGWQATYDLSKRVAILHRGGYTL